MKKVMMQVKQGKDICHRVSVPWKLAGWWWWWRWWWWWQYHSWPAFRTVTCWHTALSSPHWGLQTNHQTLPDIRLSDASRGKYKALKTRHWHEEKHLHYFVTISKLSFSRQASFKMWSLPVFAHTKTYLSCKLCSSIGAYLYVQKEYCYFQTSGKYNIASTVLHIPKCHLPTLLSCSFVWITGIIKFHSQTRHFLECTMLSPTLC